MFDFGLDRRQWLQGMAGASLISTAWAQKNAAPHPAEFAHPTWAEFSRQFIQADGRVIADDGNQANTYSEGQSYALFFALVANDRTQFDRLLKWTRDNLSQGDLGSHLPGWLWGRNEQGQWGLLDSNSASDADLWIAYVLIHAGRLWRYRPYLEQGRALSKLILRKESADLPGLGWSLLPGPAGFVEQAGQRWRLNPSYVPLQLLQSFAVEMPEDPWAAMAAASLEMLVRSAPKGFSPDWTIYDRQKGFLPDNDGKKKGVGSYDAIRTYLWAGMLHPQAVGRDPLLRVLMPMATMVSREGVPPEHIHPVSLKVEGTGPSGFSAALLPFLQAQGAEAAVQAQRKRLKDQPLRPTAYYEQCLSMFAISWMRGEYRFDAKGQLVVPWFQR